MEAGRCTRWPWPPPQMLTNECAADTQYAGDPAADRSFDCRPVQRRRGLADIERIQPARPTPSRETKNARRPDWTGCRGDHRYLCCCVWARTVGNLVGSWVPLESSGGALE